MLVVLCCVCPVLCTPCQAVISGQTQWDMALSLLDEMQQSEAEYGRIQREGQEMSGGSCCALLVCFILAPAKLSDFT